MGQLSRFLCCTALVATLTACGGMAKTPAPQSPPAVFPLTIKRTGGIAGFSDVLVVARDGLVSVTRKGKAMRRCQLTPSAVKQLTTAASQVPWPHITPASTDPAFPDEIVSTVQSAAGGPLRLGDPQAGEAGRVFLELFEDINAGATASRTCTSV